MNKKILIIDDEKDFSYFVKENLQRLTNYEVITSDSGKKGMRAALKEKPDLILLDVIMPDIDGFQVLKKLKENDKTYHIPVIMLTAKNEDESKIKASGLYADDYIVKPVKARILMCRIHGILSLRA